MANTPVSPKVKAGANWAMYATLALTLLSTLTPQSLDFLGNLAPLAYGLVVGATYALGAYLKADPLREAGAAAPEPATVSYERIAVHAPELAPTPPVIAPEDLAGPVTVP